MKVQQIVAGLNRDKSSRFKLFENFVQLSHNIRNDIMERSDKVHCYTSFSCFNFNIYKVVLLEWIFRTFKNLRFEGIVGKAHGESLIRYFIYSGIVAMCFCGITAQLINSHQDIMLNFGIAVFFLQPGHIFFDTVLCGIALYLVYHAVMVMFFRVVVDGINLHLSVVVISHYIKRTFKVLAICLSYIRLISFSAFEIIVEQFDISCKIKNYITSFKQWKHRCRKYLNKAYFDTAVFDFFQIEFCASRVFGVSVGFAIVGKKCAKSGHCISKVDKFYGLRVSNFYN